MRKRFLQTLRSMGGWAGRHIVLLAIVYIVLVMGAISLIHYPWLTDWLPHRLWIILKLLASAGSFLDRKT